MVILFIKNGVILLKRSWESKASPKPKIFFNWNHLKIVKDSNKTMRFHFKINQKKKGRKFRNKIKKNKRNQKKYNSKVQMKSKSQKKILKSKPKRTAYITKSAID